MTVDCPLDCEYLREARRHEKPPELSEKDIPHNDIEITERFLEENEVPLAYVSRSLVQAALQTPGAVDLDVREALESMIKTQRTLDSGLIYTSRPNNPLAAAIQQQVQADIEEFRKEATQETGLTTVRDKDLLGTLVFLARMELSYNNGRRRGRACLDFLKSHFLPDEPAADSPLIQA